MMKATATTPQAHALDPDTALQVLVQLAAQVPLVRADQETAIAAGAILAEVVKAYKASSSEEPVSSQ